MAQYFGLIYYAATMTSPGREQALHAPDASIAAGVRAKTVTFYHYIYDTTTLTGPADLINAGYIANAYLGDGGKITNAAKAAIYELNGVGSTTINNSGVITRYVDIGSGDITNAAGATVGYVRSTGLITITNLGVITSSAQFGSGIIDNGDSTELKAEIGGVEATGSVTVTNWGTIAGVSAGLTATVTNRGTIDGISAAGGQVTNYGVVAGPSTLTNGGTVINGGTAARFAVMDNVAVTGAAPTRLTNFGLIQGVEVAGEAGVPVNFTAGQLTNAAGGVISGEWGVQTGDGVVLNYGKITASAYVAVILTSDGKLTNGSLLPGGDSALIQGSSGVQLRGLGSVYNLGVIDGAYATPNIGSGVSMAPAGGYVKNGVNGKSVGTIKGYSGILCGPRGLVTNFGTIEGDGDAELGVGASVGAGAGTFFINNGVSGSSKETISGYSGIQASGDLSLSNFGTVEGLGTPSDNQHGAAVAGVYLMGGGGIDNGGDDAVISGLDGVHAVAKEATVTNLGAIKGTGGMGPSAPFAGVFLAAGGTVSNDIDGSVYGVISGADGVVFHAVGTVRNYGEIQATGEGSAYAGVFLSGGGAVVNETDASDPGAGLIQGYVGVEAEIKNVTISNAGTIAGASVGAHAAGVYTQDVAIDLTNGTAHSAVGLIEGYVGLHTAVSGTKVENYATIDATGAGPAAWGILLGGGGDLGNHGTISGADAVHGMGAAATLANYGKMLGAGTGQSSAGVGLTVGGSLINHAAGVVQGFSGVRAGPKSVTITNLAAAVIQGTGATAQAAGVYLTGGGEVTNAGTIEGYDGVHAVTKSASVSNTGTIMGTGVSHVDEGVCLRGGGDVTNGMQGASGGVIQGDTGVYADFIAATVTNYGTIEGLGTVAAYAAGVCLRFGGEVTNQGVVKGVDGVDITTKTAKVLNSGTITATGSGTRSRGSAGVFVTGGGVVTNKSLYSLSGRGADAVIQSQAIGVSATTVAATVMNYGTILVTGGSATASGVNLAAGGLVENGPVLNGTAVIDGGMGSGVSAGATATVVNSGVIRSEGVGSTSPAGIFLSAGGSVSNMGTVKGADGVEAGLSGSVATVVNAGVITGGASNALNGGVVLFGGASVNNSGTIEGFDGVNLGFSTSMLSNSKTGMIMGLGGSMSLGVSASGGTITNLGVIQGADGVQSSTFAATISNSGAIKGTGTRPASAHGISDFGLFLAGGGGVTNGVGVGSAASITGYTGVFVSDKGTLINFGTIAGAGGVAVQFLSPGSTLVLENGAVFQGSIMGGGGILNLASVTGNMSETSTTDGLNVTVAGMSYLFSGFAIQILGPTSQVALSGTETIAKGVSFADAGVITVTGALSLAGTISGAGTLAITGGATTFDAGASLTVASLILSGAATVSAASLAYAGVWTQKSGTLSVGGGDKISFNGAGDAFAGTISGAGAVDFAGGADTFTALHLSAAGAMIDGASVTLSGAIALAGDTLTATTAHLVIAAAGASLNGGGVLDLTNQATNAVIGAAAGATLTNANASIEGAGQLGDGQMTLINAKGAVIDGDDPLALTINTGANVIANAGLIEAKGAGGVVIKSAVDNTGSLDALGGDLTVMGAVTGNGSVTINNGVADFAASFSEDVAFAGGKGTLELAHSQVYAGTITGFSKTGTTALDLADIAFVAGSTKASYAGTTVGGVLTVTDGTLTASIHLTGNYLASVWTVSGAAGGGTKIVDPQRGEAAGAPRRRSAQPDPSSVFVQTMAAVAPDHAAASAGSEPGRLAPALLVTPRACLA